MPGSFATAVDLTVAGVATVDAPARQPADELGKLLHRLDEADQALILNAGQALSRLADDL